MHELLATSAAPKLGLRSPDRLRHGRFFVKSFISSLRLAPDGRKSANFDFLSSGKKIYAISRKEFKFRSAKNDFFRSSPLRIIEPYVVEEWRFILVGWICSAVSVICLTWIVPNLGQISSVMVVLKLGIVGVVRSVACYLQQAFLWEAALRAVCKIRVDVFRSLLYRDLEFFEGRGGLPTGEVAHRIIAEAQDIADTVFALLNTSLPNVMQLLAMATQMVLISPVLSMISALFLPLMFLAVAHLGSRLREISLEAHSSTAKLSSYLNEVLQSMLVVKANNAEISESTRFQKFAHIDLMKRLKKRQAKALVPEIVKVMHIGGTLLLCAAAVLGSKGLLDFSQLVSFIVSLALLVDPIESVGKAYNELKQGEPAIERLCYLSKFTPRVVERPDAVDKETVKGDLKFCDVTFTYEENSRPVIDRLNLHIRPGETVAFVGPSGGGKTTLTKLLLRLYDPQSGSILLDDEDIRGIRLRSLRKHIGLVSQDMALFSGTVAENIGYKDLMGEINMDLVENAARAANAVEFIKNLPDGYHTDLGMKGSALSGGQRQRLAIARALYEDSSILILDEATSALDNKSEMIVRQALDSLTEKHTVLVIAHRRETLLMADRIFVLDRGTAKEVDRSALLPHTENAFLE
ncbi:ABC2 homolog 12 isoform X1 [Wolffia australiana]